MNSYSETKLDNGLTLIVGENPASPIITLQLVVRAGSSYENQGELGYAHILEHMLLKGTKRHPTSYLIGLEIDRIGPARCGHQREDEQGERAGEAHGGSFRRW